MSVAAIVLAAGASRRMGQPKQLAQLNEETLLERSVRICHEAGLNLVIVVLGAAADEIVRRVALPQAMILRNEQWDEGIASSIALGVLSIPEGCRGAVILTCDMPSVTPSHLRELAACEQVTASQYAGRQGVPAFFPRSCFEELQALRGDTGARAMLGGAEAIPLSGGELDVDTPADLERARAIFS
ncbi:MAG: nucleotidyltransferase family protein [Edaphobacter sp.]|uniref:nucleotidyltransferase family protein n=1 Tax=Edaphobacter sp. TaxID=1934404 RepID=UPI0023A485FC|nr:nucleotidyltransferase family protein [Edaphobacter sp.]MDE1177798.1 nucleotidyltransferase family protein [Edaphobacter sp.]